MAAGNKSALFKVEMFIYVEDGDCGHLENPENLNFVSFQPFILKFQLDELNDVLKVFIMANRS
jgi:hypothetical protein